MVDANTLVLTLIGKVPLLGDAIKDQIQHHEQEEWKRRTLEFIGRLQKRLAKVGSVPKDPQKQKELADFIASTMREIGNQQFEEKRAAMEEILAKTVEHDVEIGRSDYLMKAVSRMSLDSLRALKVFVAKGPINNGSQFHPGTPPISDLQSLFGYDYMSVLLRELQSMALIDMDVDYSSKTREGDPRIVVFWKRAAQEFLNYIRAP